MNQLNQGLPLNHAIAVGIDYPLMKTDNNKTCQWQSLAERVGKQKIFAELPWQPLHATFVREINAKQLELAKWCLRSFRQESVIVKGYDYFSPLGKNYDAIVQIIDVPILDNLHDVMIEAFNVNEHYRFHLHVTLLRVKRGLGKTCLNSIKRHFHAALQSCQLTDTYYCFKPDTRWETYLVTGSDNVNGKHP